MDRLQTFVGLLEKWNPKINLVSKSTIPDLWTRHIQDSLQVFNLIQNAPDHWVDLGTGGGFPGIVAAICGSETGMHTTLVESDHRKCAFLRTVVREVGLNAKVLSERIEETAPLNADVLSARALADLPTLLGFAQRHSIADGIALFPKGKSWNTELVNARENWNFTYVAHKSETDAEAVVLEIREIARV